MEEKWRPVVGYEQEYQVSSLGRIYSQITGRILKGGIDTDGYHYFAAYKNGVRKNLSIHRVVAEAFIENPGHLPLVNHKDEITANNQVDNLEWCTHLYNNTYNDTHIKKGVAYRKPVYQYDSSGNLVDSFDSARSASQRTGFSYGNIAGCCTSILPNSKAKYQHTTTNGYLFSYDGELTQEEARRLFAFRGHKI